MPPAVRIFRSGAEHPRPRLFKNVDSAYRPRSAPAGRGFYWGACAGSRSSSTPSRMNRFLCRPKNLMLARSTGSIGTKPLREGPARSRSSSLHSPLTGEAETNLPGVGEIAVALLRDEQRFETAFAQLLKTCDHEDAGLVAFRLEPITGLAPPVQAAQPLRYDALGANLTKVSLRGGGVPDPATAKKPAAQT